MKLFVTLLFNFFQVLLFCQDHVDWHYLSSYATNTSVVSTLVTDTYIQNLYHEQGVGFHNEILDVNGNFISRNSLSYTYPYYFDGVEGFVSDYNQGAYVWGFSYTDITPDYYFLAHLNADMEVDWMHTYTDSVRLYPGSFIQNGSDVYLIGTSTYEILVYSYVDGVLSNACGFTHENAGDIDGSTITCSGFDNALGAISIFNERYDSLLVYTLDADCVYTQTYIDDIPPLPVYAGNANYKLLYTEENNRIYSCFRKDETDDLYQVIVCLDPDGNVLWDIHTELNPDIFLDTQTYPYDADTFINICGYTSSDLYYAQIKRISYAGEVLDTHTLLMQDYLNADTKPAYSFDQNSKDIIAYISDINMPDRSGLIIYAVEDATADTLTIPFNYTSLAQFNNIITTADHSHYLITLHADAALAEYLEVTQISDITGSVPNAYPIQTCTVYPNPVTSTIHLTMPIPNNKNYQIIDLLGNSVQSGTINDTYMQVSSLPPGLYQIVITQMDSVYYTYFEKM